MFLWRTHQRCIFPAAGQFGPYSCLSQDIVDAPSGMNIKFKNQLYYQQDILRHENTSKPAHQYRLMQRCQRHNRHLEALVQYSRQTDIMRLERNQDPGDSDRLNPRNDSRLRNSVPEQ